MTSQILKGGISFSVGQHFIHEDTIFHIVDAIDQHFLLENLETLDRKIILAERLYQLYLTKKIFPTDNPADSASLASQNNAFEPSPTLLVEHSSEAISWGRMLYVLITGLRSLGYLRYAGTRAMSTIS